MRATLGSKRFAGVMGKSSVKLVNDWFSLPESSLLLEQRGRVARGGVQPPGPDAGLGSAPGELCAQMPPHSASGEGAGGVSPHLGSLWPGSVLSDKPFILE